MRAALGGRLWNRVGISRGDRALGRREVHRLWLPAKTTHHPDRETGQHRETCSQEAPHAGAWRRRPVAVKPRFARASRRNEEIRAFHAVLAREFGTDEVAGAAAGDAGDDE